MRRSFCALVLIGVIFIHIEHPSPNAFAFNREGHTQLMESAVNALKDWWGFNEAYEFFRGNNSDSVDIFALNAEPDSDGMVPRIIWPNFFSTTAPNQLAYINFLKDADFQPETPVISEHDFSAIKHCIEQFSTLEITPEEDRAWEATIETNIDLQDRDQRPLLVTFPIRKLNQLLLGSTCINLGKMYKDQFLSGLRTVYTANHKAAEYAQNAVSAFGIDRATPDLDEAFTWLLRTLNLVQQASVPSKSRPLPEEVSLNEEEVRVMWCQEVLHRLAFLAYSNFIDSYTPSFDLAVPEPPQPFDRSFAEASRASVNALAALTQETVPNQTSSWFEMMDGFPNTLNDLRFNFMCLPERNLLKLPNVNDDFAQVADRFLAVDVIYQQALLLYEIHRQFVALPENAE